MAMVVTVTTDTVTGTAALVPELPWCELTGPE